MTWDSRFGPARAPRFFFLEPNGVNHLRIVFHLRITSDGNDPRKAPAAYAFLDSICI